MIPGWLFVRKHMFKNTDRFVGILSLLFGIVSLVFSVFVYKYPEPPPDYIITRDFLIVANLTLVVVLLSIRRTIASYRANRIRNHLRDYYNHAHSMMLSHQRSLFDYCYKAIQEPRNLSDAAAKEELRLFRDFCLPITQELRNSLRNYCKMNGFDVGEDITITVKLIVKKSDIIRLRNLSPEDKLQVDQQPEWAITAYREPYTNQRGNVDSTSFYSITINSAFHDILQAEQPCYFHNNLSSLGKQYINQNKHWQKYYNSTIVVPIIYEGHSGLKPVVFGFLAADSLNEERLPIYDSDGCLVIMQHAADMLANFFITLSLYDYQPSGGGTSGVSSTPPTI